MNQKTKKLVTIGLSAVVALAILFFGINYLKGINIFHSSNYYFAVYENVTGLAVSAPVNANGFKVGQVRDMKYLYNDPGHVQIELALDADLKITEGTVAIMTTDLLGTGSITLEIPKTGKYLPKGSTLESTIASGLMDNLSSDLMPGITGVLPKIDSLLVAVTNVVTDPSLGAALKRLDAITADLNTMSANIAKATKPLPGVIDNASVVASNLNTMSAKLDTLSTTLQNLPLDQTMANVQSLTLNLKEITDKLQTNESSLGLLMNDPALYQNLNNTVASLDSLLINIKANPKRYISIKLL
ncbi:MAG: MlaD family protein [Bacteroides sp.]|nr:MlaD family protein [Bacteroides sp.]MCM1378712.1 MlaD family protein [Bacteroides sp.]MCM1444985.1 MlaD family protein [Prevotella sp.]